MIHINISLNIQRLLSILMFLFIPLSILAPHAIVWEIILGGIMALYHARKQKLVELPLPITLIAIAIPLWGMTTALWSVNPNASLLLGLKVLGLVFLSLYWCRFILSLNRSLRRKLLNAFMAGLCLGLLFFIIEILSGEPWRHYWLKPSSKAYAHSSILLAISSWPALKWALDRPYALSLRLLLIACFLVSIFWILLHIDCDVSPISLLLGVGVCGATFLLPRMTSLNMRLVMPLIVILFPLVSLYGFKPESIPSYNKYIHSASYIDRLYIWNEIATSIFEHPWLGIGMDGTRHHEKAKIMRKWSYINEKGEHRENQSTLFPLHPHNAILQLWLELGFMGVILGTFLTYLLLYYIYRTNLAVVEKSIAAGLFMSAFVIDWFSVGFWQNWWISGLWIIIGLTVTQFKENKEIYAKSLP